MRSLSLLFLIIGILPEQIMRVLIIGAGIAGPTLAWFLAKTGAHITVIEKNHTFLPHGQNIDIKGSAVKIFKKMGLLEEVRRLNTRERGTQFIDTTGRPFASFPIEGTSASLTSEYEILRGDLAMLLYKATRDHPQVEYVLGTTIKHVISNDDKCVKVELSNGGFHEYDLLVAADGQWSKVRKQCFQPEQIQAVDMNMYAAYWTTPRLPTDNDWWNIYIGLRSRLCSLRPDPHGTMRAMFTLMPRNEEQRKAWQTASRSDRNTQEDLVRSEFASIGWEAPRLLDAVRQSSEFYFHAIQQIKMSTWSNGRVVCSGDTAYAPTPLTGMGTSLAITGAYILAGELSKLRDGENPSQALKAYESIFRPFVEDSQRIPWLVPGIAHPATEWKRWLLGTGIWALAKVVSVFANVPWFENRYGPGDEGDFVLPEYSAFNGTT